MNQIILKVSNLSVNIEHQELLNNISFEVKRNETLAIIGPNGAGKTTLFRCLLGLTPYTGKVEWQKGIKIGYVPQKFYIPSDLPLTVKEYFGLKKNFEDEVRGTLLSVGFKNPNHILNKKLGLLSGGEIQRIIIAWALLGNPDILLFDEPTAGIDVSAEDTIYDLLNSLKQKKNLTLLLISHELQVVNTYADNVICLNKKTICYGPPKKTLSNESLMNLFGSNVEFYHHH